MEKEFIPYEQALELKELGFDDLVCGYFYTLNIPREEVQSVMWANMNKEANPHIPEYYISAPLYQQAFRFFREKYGLSSSIILKMNYNKRKSWFMISELDNRIIKTMYFKTTPKGFFSSYEEAELECLKKLIEICKKN